MRLLLLAAVGFISVLGIAECRAQQADPRIDAYRQLLTEANDRVVNLIGQASALQTENAALKKQIEDAKKPAETKP